MKIKNVIKIIKFCQKLKNTSLYKQYSDIFLPGLIALTIIIAILPGGAQILYSATSCQYPVQTIGTDCANITWPSTWQVVSTEHEPLTDAPGSDGHLDLVGNPNNPEIYRGYDGTYLFFRIRTNYYGTVAAKTFADTIWLMFSTNVSTDPVPAYSFSWDSKSSDLTKHGLEMQVKDVVSPADWAAVQFTDYDADSNSKGANDIGTNGEGYVRTVDNIACTPTASQNVCNNTYHTFVDMVVKCSYFTRVGLPNFCTQKLYVLAGDRQAATDHNALGSSVCDLGRNSLPTETITLDDWGSPTAAFVDKFKVYNNGGKTSVKWTTGAESKTAGFNLYRIAPDGSGTEKVNDNIIPALLENENDGVYRVIDVGAPSGQPLTYILEEIEIGSTKINHGPYTVKASGNDDVYDNNVFSDNYSRSPVEKKAATKEKIVRLKASTSDTADTAVSYTVKIGIKESGLYRIEASDIAAATGLSLDTVSQRIENNRFALTNRGKSIAVKPAPDNSALYFYGEGFKNNYTDENVYVLTKGKPLLMGTTSTSPGSSSATSSFMDYEQLEENMLAATAIFTAPDEDYWLWNYVSAGDSTIGAKTFDFNVSGVSGYGVLTANLYSLTKTGLDNEHRIAFNLNGTELGETTWSGVGAQKVSFVPVGLFEGKNTLQVTAIRNPGVPYSIVGIDSFDLSYLRLYWAGTDDYLSFTGYGNEELYIDGFSSPDIWVLDLNDPNKPNLVEGFETGSSDGTAWVRMIPAPDDRKYLAVNLASAKAPNSVTTYLTAGLKKGMAGADYIVITSPELKSAAAELAAYRGTRYKTLVVTTDEIYNEFSEGFTNPNAIKDFIKYAAERWKRAPRFVVLAGEGSYDYRDNLGYHDSIVPSIMMKAPNGATPSDVLYVATDSGNDLRNIAIGRIPAMTETELRTYIAKLRRYERDAGAWKNKVILFADNPDNSGDFRSDSDAIAAVIPSRFSAEKIYMPDLPVETAKARLLAGIKHGVFAVNYLGHSAYDYLAHERILSKADIPALANANHLPILIAMTCHVGHYGLPGRDTLSEALVAADTGAIAVWAPSTLVLPLESNSLHRDFWMQLSSYRTLGEAVNAALRNYFATGGSPYAPYSYNLLGDPAIRIAK